METLKLVYLMENYGLDKIILSVISFLLFLLVKKVFRKLPSKYYTLIKLLISASVYAVYSYLTHNLNGLPSGALSVFGITYSVCKILKIGDATQELKDFLSLFLDVSDQSLDKLSDKNTSDEEVYTTLKEIAKDGLDEKEHAFLTELIKKTKG